MEQVVREAFALELQQGQIQSVDVQVDCSIIAVVGDDMAGLPGVAAKFFGTLGNAGINVRAIAQGSSERNISAVIDKRDATRALRAAHSGFYLSAKTISLGLIGPGNVGGTLLDQMAAQAERLQRRVRPGSAHPRDRHLDPDASRRPGRRSGAMAGRD